MSSDVINNALRDAISRSADFISANGLPADVNKDMFSFVQTKRSSLSSSVFDVLVNQARLILDSSLLLSMYIDNLEKLGVQLSHAEKTNRNGLIQKNCVISSFVHFAI